MSLSAKCVGSPVRVAIITQNANPWCLLLARELVQRGMDVLVLNEKRPASKPAWCRMKFIRSRGLFAFIDLLLLHTWLRMRAAAGRFRRILGRRAPSVPYHEGRPSSFAATLAAMSTDNEAGKSYEWEDVESVHDAASVQRLASWRPDVTTLCGAPLLRKSFVDSAGLLVNPHCGIVPDYRGSSPANWAAYRRDWGNIGFTIHRVVPRVDGGPVIYQERVKPRYGWNLTDLDWFLVHTMYERLVELLSASDWSERVANAQPQTDSQASLPPMGLLKGIVAARNLRRFNKSEMSMDGEDEVRGCAICGEVPGSRAARLIRSPYVEKTYTLHACERCNSLTFDIHEHDVDVASIYEGMAETGQSVAADKGEFRPCRYWRDQVGLVSRLARGRVQSVLDVGCHTGDFLMHWPAEVRRVGIELADKAAAVAESRGLIVKQGYIEDIEVDERFDAVTCYALVEHLADPSAFLRRLSTLASDRGVVAIMVPTHECLKQRLATWFGRRWYMFCPPLHLSFLGRRHLDRVMAEQGFRLAARRYTSGGLVNPFSSVPVLGRTFSRLMYLVDTRTPFNRLPIFDHMYSYYRRI